MTSASRTRLRSTNAAIGPAMSARRLGCDDSAIAGMFRLFPDHLTMLVNDVPIDVKHFVQDLYCPAVNIDHLPYTRAATITPRGSAPANLILPPVLPQDDLIR